MSTNRTIRKPRGQAAGPAPEPDWAATADTSGPVATSAGDGITMASPAARPDTAATRALSAAMAARRGSTVAELAEAAEISKSAASKALIALEKAGLASRHLGGFEGAKRMPDRWQMGALIATAPEAGEPADVTVEGAEAVGAPESAGGKKPKPAPGAGRPITTVTVRSDSPEAPAAGGGEARLPGGRLREMVLDHLRSHPDEEFTPFVIGRELGRSSGAVANACDRLLAEGASLETSQKPRRFRFAG
jgi:DNA-binding transcriptional ArsR family regulator